MRTLLCLAAVLALSGCCNNKCETKPESKTASTMSVNAKCPMSGKPVDGTHTVAYKGQTVGFCCGNCPASWDKLSEADKDAKLAAAKR